MDSGTRKIEPAMPSTLSEVESLIRELYQPGSPRKISRIQETLQKLQRSPEGWQLGNRLLESSDEKAKFFGALTFTVKLNSDSDSLSPLDAEALLGQLINWLIRCLDQMVRPLVTRKLCSTLVVYFLHFSSLWPKCIRYLIHSLCIGEAVALELLEQGPDIALLIERLTAEKASAALWFSAALAEEVGKTDANHIKHHKFHDRLKLNVDDVVALIARGLKETRRDDGAQTKLRQDAMKCFQSWVFYSHRAFIDAAITLDPLKTITKVAITCLVQREMYEVTVELFSDILANYSKFLSDEDFQLLFALFDSQWSRERYERLVQGDFEFDSLQFGQFMISFGDATVQDLARKVDTESQQFLRALSGLLAAKGYAVAEDHIFVPALEFWSTFAEVMIDSLYSDEEVEVSRPETVEDSTNSDVPLLSERHLHRGAGFWFSTARSHIIHAIEHCWRKIQFPPADIFESWDSADRIGFADARKDVADLLQSSYTLTGTSLFSLFASMILQSLSTGDWEELEASLFCLGALADSIDEDTCDSILAGIFGSALFGVLTDEDTQIPVRTRQTTLSLIGQYDGYFQRHIEYLPNALNFLFKSLRTPSLSGTASRSIHSLCYSCRHALMNELDTFLQQYELFASSRSADALVKERIVGAIAAIVQAIPTEEGKRVPVVRLLEFVEIDFQRCLALLAIGGNEEAEVCGLEALRCLASIAKGLQVPTDVPVDLDNVSGSGTVAQFWITGDGVLVQRHIQTIIERLVAMVPHSGDIVEAACSVFRAGFTERLPGPFVMSPDSVAAFLLKAHPGTPRIGAIIITACALASSYTAEPSGRIDDALRKLLIWLLEILQNLKEPANDPEIAQTGIDYVHRLLPGYVNILLEQPSDSLENFFMFTLRALTGRDPLPKSAAADFWSHFVALANLPAPLQAFTNTVMEHLGPALAEALIYNISGNAARSELDRVSEPLKKLVARQVRSKSWLESALFHKDFAGDRVAEGEKRIFLQKIVSLRGAKQTNQVVRDFWLVCRGSSFAYAS